jgi:hypothetical protein
MPVPPPVTMVTFPSTLNMSLAFATLSFPPIVADYDAAGDAWRISKCDD